MNGILPARGGDALKIVLAKRSVERSSYPTIISSFAVLSPFDIAIGLLVLLYAITQGLLPRAPRLPHLPAFEIAFWAAHPEVLMLTLTVIGIGVVALVAILSRRVESFWQRVKQGLAIFREPTRYLREVAAWQGVAWLCRFASFWLFLEAFHVGGSVQNVLLVMSVQSITRRASVHPGRSGRAAGAPGGNARRGLAHGRPRLLGRPAARGHRLVGDARLRGAPLLLPGQRLARP